MKSNIIHTFKTQFVLVKLQLIQEEGKKLVANNDGFHKENKLVYLGLDTRKMIVCSIKR